MPESRDASLDAGDGPLRLDGRTCLVTGAGRGAGRGIAIALAREGGQVVVNDVDAPRAEAVGAELVAAGARAHVEVFDVTDRAAVDEGVLAAANALGPIDVLVNNAGQAGVAPMYPEPFRTLDPDRWPAWIDVNLYGVLHCTRAVINGMCERGWGRVITISSGVAMVGQGDGLSVYAAAKGAAISFMRTLAVEVGPAGVTANTVTLGVLEGSLPPPIAEEARRRVPAGRLGRPDDVGALCAFLASDAAAWIAGQTIGCNGGMITS